MYVFAPEKTRCLVYDDRSDAIRLIFCDLIKVVTNSLFKIKDNACLFDVKSGFVWIYIKNKLLNSTRKFAKISMQRPHVNERHPARFHRLSRGGSRLLEAACRRRRKKKIAKSRFIIVKDF
jgi:hypothetical protein